MAERMEWTVGVDSTVVRGHQHAAGARHEPPKDIPTEKLMPLLPAPVTAAKVAAEPAGHTGGWVE